MSKTRSVSKSGKYDAMELSLLCHQLSAYLKSGMSPLEGIPLAAEDIKAPEMKSSLLLISERMIQGTSLSSAFLQTGRFPDYMLRMLEIGENTGMLDTVMENLANYYETEADIRKSMRSAITYPVVLGILMLGVISLLILKVIPMFGEILQSLGGQVPAEALVLFSFAGSMKSFAAWFLGIIVLIILSLMIIVRLPRGRMGFDRFKIKNPFSGTLYKKITASRLSQGISLTLKSGMNIMEGFQSIIGLSDNVFINKELKKAEEKITEGKPFSEAINETGLFPEMFSRMIRTGERSGHLDLIMQKLSGIYAREAEQSFKKFSSAIEPAMVTILSILLGMILLSVLLPLIGIMSSIG